MKRSELRKIHYTVVGKKKNGQRWKYVFFFWLFEFYLWDLCKEAQRVERSKKMLDLDDLKAYDNLFNK